MAVYKDNNGTWYISVRYVNWKGEHARKVKRGFATKREATDWERNFLHENAGNLDMSFETFVDLYKKNLKERLKLSTWQTKVSIIDTKILPYFKKKRINDIKVSDVVAWQNTLLNMEDENGERYSLVYLKTIHNQLSAIFNHAVRYYDLQSNPAAKAGNMGKEKTREMLYWTKEEYIQFSNAIMDKPVSFYAFEILYWCGLRLGEMLALTPSDFNFEKNILRINKSYQKIGTEDVITDPKTPKSIRNVQMPDFLADEMQDYISSLYEIEPDQRIFPITKSYMANSYDAYSYEDGTFEAFHPELVVHPFDGTDYEDLHMAIKKIPMPHRERLIKKFFHGMTIIEIADEEGTTKQAVSKSINKALTLLKISLQNG